ncbi:MAG: hypothetical protein ACLFR2_09840 [Candidatus Kapaibacterium sp.]
MKTNSRKFGLIFKIFVGSILSLTGILLLLAAIFIYSSNNVKKIAKTKDKIEKVRITNPGDSSLDTSKTYSKAFIEAISTDKYGSALRVSDSSVLALRQDDQAAFGRRRVFDGRRINIAVTGVDSRLGSRYKHADANHVLSILIDKGIIEITSIPRDTETDCGLEDTTVQNKLTILRAVKGRRVYLDSLAKIAGVDHIHYYVEFGFSQAMGILEWLGYKDSKSTLQVLRARSGLGGDDFQRTYNQGQFIRQMLMTQFHRFTGLSGEIFIRGGLTLTETNINYKKAKEIIQCLKNAGFPRDAHSVYIRVRPAVKIKFDIYDFTDENIVYALSERISSYNTSKKKNGLPKTDFSVLVTETLDKAIKSSEKDSAARPILVINKLKTYFDQKAWLQVDDKTKRRDLRKKICEMLEKAYSKKGDKKQAGMIRAAYQNEVNLFGQK